MRYQGSEAYNLTAAEMRQERLERAAAPSFEVVTGGGLDAKARAGVTPAFLARVRAIVAVAAILIAFGMVRVAVSAATVSLLQSNSELSSQIEETTALNDQLRVQRSILSSNARISRIATQNYGMVLSGEVVTIDVSDALEARADAEAGVDGDAAQAAESGDSSENLA